MTALKTFLFRFGTPMTVGLFLISAVSGVALFFHVGTNLFREMHEILSMVLLVPVVVHMWRNWRAFVNYFARWAMPASLAICLAAGGWFAYEGLGESSGGNPAFALVNAAQKAQISELAPVLGLDADSALKRLGDAGYGAVTASDSIADVAGRAGTDAFEVLATLTAPAQ